MTLPIGTAVTYNNVRHTIIGYADNAGATWYKIRPVGSTGIHYNTVSGKYFYDIVEPPDPCKGVVCNPVCVGVDRYEMVCKDGVCVRGALMEANSIECGYYGGTIMDQPLPNTIEFQELIPGIKPPRVPILIPGLEKLPLLPGWIIRDPEGKVINAGIRIPVLMWEIVQTPEEPPERPPEEHPVMPILPDISTLSVDALEEEEMEL